MDGASPMLLSSCGSLERQCHALGALARLVGLPECQHGDEALTEEIKRLRQNVYSADLDRSSSQARLVALHWAVRNDPSLLVEQMQQNSEAERQHFWNSIHKRIKEKDFTEFQFTAEEFNAHWEEEKQKRAGDVEPLKKQLATFEIEREQQMRTWINACAQELTKLDCQMFASNDAIQTHVDALSLEGPDSLWVAAEVRHPPIASGFARDLVLMVDLSGSMCDIIELLKECLLDIVARTSPDDRLCIVGFSSEPHLLCDWTALTDDAHRSTVRAAIVDMAAQGGTNLVPAFRMVENKLQELACLDPIMPMPASTTSPLELMPCHRGSVSHSAGLTSSQPTSGPRPRVTAVVLLSDGDPEEPPEAVWTSACHALSVLPSSRATLVALALGEGSNPALMALAAQCGGGPSLYIRSSTQMPEQIGRMWGYLSTLAKPRDLCLLLSPTDGGEIIEVERPLGGSAELRSGEQQFVVMCCGSAVAGSAQRLAVLLKLPLWARSRTLDANDIEKPLLRMTWFWREGQGHVQAASSQLRVLQVPSLFLESQLGLPVRVVIDADWGMVDRLDRSVFLNALADALNVPAGKLVLDRLSPGSIVADFHIIDPSLQEFQNIKHACTVDLNASRSSFALMCERGFPVKTILVPGSIVFQRVLQWRFSQALEMAVRGCRGVQALTDVQNLACSNVVSKLDAGTEGTAAAVATDAAVAKDQLLVHIKNGKDLSAPTKHALLQQAHGHCQQFCPELQPGPTAVAAYESEPLRLSASAFVASSRHRDEPLAAPIVEPASPDGEVQRSGSVSVRICAQGDGAMAAVAFRVEIYTECSQLPLGTTTMLPVDAEAQCNEVPCPDPQVLHMNGSQVSPLLIEDWSLAAGEAFNGIKLTLGDLPVGLPLFIRAAASTGSRLGLWSLPLQCYAHEAIDVTCSTSSETPCTTLENELASMMEPASPPVTHDPQTKRKPIPSHKRQSLSKSRRSQPSMLAGTRRNSQRLLSSGSSSPQIQLVHAAIMADSAILTWAVSNAPPPLPSQRWSVTMRPLGDTEPLGHLGGEVQGCSAQINGLRQSQAYHFCIQAADAPVPATRAAVMGGGLCIQGSAISNARPPRAVEGVVLSPPLSDDLLYPFLQDPTLQQVAEGVFISKELHGLQK